MGDYREKLRKFAEGIFCLSNVCKRKGNTFNESALWSPKWEWRGFAFVRVEIPK
jgi:hypothetical protein